MHLLLHGSYTRSSNLYDEGKSLNSDFFFFKFYKTYICPGKENGCMLAVPKLLGGTFEHRPG